MKEMGEREGWECPGCGLISFDEVPPRHGTGASDGQGHEEECGPFVRVRVSPVVPENEWEGRIVLTPFVVNSAGHTEDMLSFEPDGEVRLPTWAEKFAGKRVRVSLLDAEGEGKCWGRGSCDV